jgi:hypothetical protein
MARSSRAAALGSGASVDAGDGGDGEPRRARIKAHIVRRPASPIGGSGLSFEAVANSGQQADDPQA